MFYTFSFVLLVITITFQKDIVPHDPLLPGNVTVIDSVEEFEDPVHQNVIRHVENVVEEFSKRVSVHTIEMFRVISVQLE